MAGRGRLVPVIGWAVVGLSIVAALGSVALALAMDRTFVEFSGGSGLTGLTLAFTFPTVGALILTRRPGHPIGWVCIAAACEPLSQLAGQLGYLGVVDDPGSIPAVGLISWVGAWIWFPGIATLLALLPSLFPTGRPLGPRWGWVVRGAIAGIVLGTIGLAAGTWPARGTASLYSEDMPDDLAPVMILFVVGISLVLLGALLGMVSLVLRYRRSSGATRLQLKWVTLAAVIAIAVATTRSTAVDLQNSVPLDVLEALTFPLIAIAIGVAILRYRLYDIDVVISRTLVFVVLAGFITSVYVAVVVGIGTLLGSGDEPDLLLSVAATAIVAVAFEPVRSRAQRWVNRLVFGRRASPYEVLSQLSSRLEETAEDQRLPQRLAGLLADGTGAAATVWLRIGELYRPVASSGDRRLEPVEAPEGTLPQVSGAAVVVPIIHDGDRLGLLTLTAGRGQQVSEADRRLVGDVAGNAGLLLRNVRLNTELAERAEELKASRERLVAVQDQERRQLERDLHDGAQQHVVAAAMQLNVAKVVATKEDLPDIADQVDELVRADQTAVDQLRTIARGIYPPLLEAEGLVAAIRGAAGPLPFRVQIDAVELDRLEQTIETSAYFCVVEALRDAGRRNASTATVAVSHNGELRINLTHDGQPGWTDHTLTRLTDRIDAHGGQLVTPPGDVTQLSITLPTEQAAEVAS